MPFVVALGVAGAAAGEVERGLPGSPPGPVVEDRGGEGGGEEGGAGVWTGMEQQDLAGDLWNAEALLGKVVLLDFWATWCAPCLAELPNLRRIHQEFGSRDFVLLGVSLDRTGRAPLRSFLLRHDMRWPQLHDGRGLGGPLPQRFAVTAVPRTVVVDRRGRMVAVDLRGAALYTLIRDLRREPAAERRSATSAGALRPGSRRR